MTIEEAIFRIKDHMNVHKIGEYPHIRLKDALDMAVSALHAQQRRPLGRSRWEGCPHCTFGTEGLLQREVKYGWKRGESVISGADEMYIIRYGDKDYSLICECTEENGHETEISFCPFCGRPLTEEA